MKQRFLQRLFRFIYENRLSRSIYLYTHGLHGIISSIKISSFETSTISIDGFKPLMKINLGAKIGLPTFVISLMASVTRNDDTNQGIGVNTGYGVFMFL